MTIRVKMRRAVPKSATVVHTCNEWGGGGGGGRELTVADGTLLPTSTTYRLGAASMR
ncbi:BZ3500_MvSof-1268-A1-R1_Chr8-2g10221 [Microbotryum saponariae]|uniref:BZ3500_MvSof-1268-A1-R1_Chr8-2g10221 protein n=1 Tax=Microbotryum saponariae TaxID=289078 RepID=A0A2X0LBZ7_9BASI|nr:BZ3500_MvSof-1268-A1-R1_Chr8-2g10221 [Microbotryum saponariae]